MGTDGLVSCDRFSFNYIVGQVDWPCRLRIIVDVCMDNFSSSIPLVDRKCVAPEVDLLIWRSTLVAFTKNDSSFWPSLMCYGLRIELALATQVERRTVDDLIVRADRYLADIITHIPMSRDFVAVDRVKGSIERIVGLGAEINTMDPMTVPSPPERFTLEPFSNRHPVESSLFNVEWRRGQGKPARLQVSTPILVLPPSPKRKRNEPSERLVPLKRLKADESFLNEGVHAGDELRVEVGSESDFGSAGVELPALSLPQANYESSDESSEEPSDIREEVHAGDELRIEVGSESDFGSAGVELPALSLPQANYESSDESSEEPSDIRNLESSKSDLEPARFDMAVDCHDQTQDRQIVFAHNHESSEEISDEDFGEYRHERIPRLKDDEIFAPEVDGDEFVFDSEVIVKTPRKQKSKYRNIHQNTDGRYVGRIKRNGISVVFVVGTVELDVVKIVNFKCTLLGISMPNPLSGSLDPDKRLTKSQRKAQSLVELVSLFGGDLKEGTNKKNECIKFANLHAGDPILHPLLRIKSREQLGSYIFGQMKRKTSMVKFTWNNGVASATLR